MKTRLMNEQEMLDYMNWLVDSINESIDAGEAYWVDTRQEMVFEDFVEYNMEEKDVELTWNDEFNDFDEFISEKLNNSPMCYNNYSLDEYSMDDLDELLYELSSWVEKPLHNANTGDSSVRAWYEIFKARKAK